MKDFLIFMNKLTMRKMSIILSVLALILGGCKPKTTSANLPTTSTQAGTLNIAQAEPQQVTPPQEITVNQNSLEETIITTIKPIKAKTKRH